MSRPGRQTGVRILIDEVTQAYNDRTPDPVAAARKREGEGKPATNLATNGYVYAGMTNVPVQSGRGYGNALTDSLPTTLARCQHRPARAYPSWQLVASAIPLTVRRSARRVPRLPLVSRAATSANTEFSAVSSSRSPVLPAAPRTYALLRPSYHLL